VDDRDSINRATLSRRAHRLGLGFAGLGASVAVTFWSWYGVFVGALVVAAGLYMAFAYLPLAASIRRREERRDSAP
jgi:hypothetical protein